MAAILQMAAPEENKIALVVGLGLTGLSCVRYLARRGYRVRGVDSRAQPPKLEQIRREFPGVELHAGGLDTPWFDEPGMLVMSPGMSLHEPAIARALELGWEPVGDIELFARVVTAPTIAITGSNGKSTVTALVGAMCRAAGLDVAIGGNIGAPALDLLDDAERDAYVLELSSFQLETTYSLNPLAATVLNLSCDHMDRYPSLDDYAAAKARLFELLSPGGRAILPVDLRRRPPFTGLRRLGFDVVPHAARAVRGARLRVEAGRFRLDDEDLGATRDLSLPGAFQGANVLVALAAARALGAGAAALRPALGTLEPLPHRVEELGTRAGVRVIDNGVSTTPESTAASPRSNFPNTR